MASTRRSGQRYVRIDGRWVHEQRGAQWVPEQWVAVGPRWHFVPGHWEHSVRRGARTGFEPAWRKPIPSKSGPGCASRQRTPPTPKGSAALGNGPRRRCRRGVSLCRRLRSATPNRANRPRRALGRSLCPRSDHGKLLACQYPVGPLDCLVHLPNEGLTQEDRP